MVFRLALIRAFRRKRTAGSGVSGVRIATLTFAGAIIMLSFVILYEVTQRPAEFLESLEKVDAWVTQEGNNNLVTSSFLSAEVEEQLSAQEGIEAEGLFVYFGTLERQSRNVLVQTYEQLLKPPLKKGRHVETDTEAVLDSHLAHSLGIEVGESIFVAGNDYKVVGMATALGSIGKELVYISQEGAFNDRLVPDPVYSAIAVNLSEAKTEWSPSSLNTSNLSIYTHREFIDNNVTYWMEFVFPLVAIIIAVATVMAIWLLGSVLKRQVDQISRQYGILRATGVKKNKLAVAEVLSVWLAVLPAFPMAIIATTALVEVLNKTTPGFRGELTPEVILGGLLTMVLISTLPLIIPIHRIRILQPADLLRS